MATKQFTLSYRSHFGGGAPSPGHARTDPYVFRTRREAREVAVAIIANAVEQDWARGIPSIDGREASERVWAAMDLKRGEEIDVYMLGFSLELS